MHDGSLQSLKQVMDFYIGGGDSYANLDKDIHALDFLRGTGVARPSRVLELAKWRPAQR